MRLFEKEVGMAPSSERPLRQSDEHRLTATLTLAWWQLRLTWRLLLVATSGVLAAVILVCTVPLYSQVALSAGLRDTLKTSTDPAITIHSVAHLISRAALQKASTQIQQDLQVNVGDFLAGSQFSAQSADLPFGEFNQIQLNGWSMKDAQRHVKLLQGRLPIDTSTQLEAAITAETANNLHVAVGKQIQLEIPFINSQANLINYRLTLSIVGIFAPGQATESFWHGTTFASRALDTKGSLYPVLVANTSYLENLEAASNPIRGGDPQNGTSLEYPTDLYWYYNFAFDTLNINHIDDLINGLNNVLVLITNQPVEEPFVDKTTSDGPIDLLLGYNDRVAVARIPMLSLAYLIAGLMLFFVSLITDLLVDRQSESIALLSSRGASRRQISGALTFQGLGAGIVAFGVGPALAVVITRLLVLFSLVPADQGALNVILADPLLDAMNLYITALVTVVVSILAMVFALNRAARMDVLMLRRETARTSRGPVWLRMGLDILAGLVALIGYGFSAYITSPGVLDARTQVLILPPVTLLGAVFLLLGCMLLFLRIFPLILELLANMTARSRGVISILAVAQMARAPRQALRMTLLLALAVAFGIFSLVFNASQEQRIPNIVMYQVGADFSGTYASNSFLSQEPLKDEEAAFEQIAGVQAASVGFSSSMRGAESGVNASIELRAVDTATFGQVGLWSKQDSSVYSLDDLMSRLASQRSMALTQQVVPAFVDAVAWQTLNLTPGASFTLSDLNGTINYVALGEVQYLPTVLDSAQANETNSYVAQGGVLTDFLSYQTVVKEVAQATINPSTVWLKTKSDAHSLASVRNALNGGPLSLLGVNDIYALENSMDNDPLYLALLGILAIGTITALLLGLIGNLTVSWLSARNRIINFAVMRALGTVPGQIAGILTYEQALIYATAIGLGVAFGLLLSFLILPAFVLTSSIANPAGGTGVFYVMQGVPPIQTIIPAILIAMVVGILLAVCILALGMMVRIVSRPVLSGVLRIDNN